MIRSLFARLTGEPTRGQPLFDLAVREARKPYWFVEGQVPDTLNGRFGVLATVVALTMVRLEREGAAGEQAGVALTERLVESLDTEIREMMPAVGETFPGRAVAFAGHGTFHPPTLRTGEILSLAGNVSLMPSERRSDELELSCHEQRANDRQGDSGERAGGQAYCHSRPARLVHPVKHGACKYDPANLIGQYQAEAGLYEKWNDVSRSNGHPCLIAWKRLGKG